MVRKLFVACFLCVLIFSMQNTVYARRPFVQALYEDLNIDREELEGSVIGLGALYSTQPYIGVDQDVSIVPLIKGRYKKFYIDGRSAGYVLNDSKEFELSVIAKPRLMGYDGDDSIELSGMKGRSGSVDGGLRLTWNNDLCKVALSGLYDLSNNHQGQEYNLVVSKVFKEGFFTPRVGVKWQSDDIIDYYYGVLGTESRPGRLAYEGDSATSFFAGFNVGIPINDDWAVVVDFNYEDLPDEVEDSPIVDEESIFTTIAGIVYRF